MKKKLIEVALPLEAINKESAREKSIRHGHPSTLHLWWARRPLAACRAVLFASLVDDPSSLPEEFPTEEAQQKERDRLFKIIEDLVKWENINNKDVLDAAKCEIMKSTGGNPPPVLDPFCGGGSIPLEAQRLGLKAYASDLNPVAVLITKALIEIPPKFAGQPPVNPKDSKKKLPGMGWEGAKGLAADVRHYGEWMRKEAEVKIGHLYPKVKLPKEQGGGEATVIAWIWARTVKCPNPGCGAEMPLVRSFELSKKTGREAWIEVVTSKSSKSVEYKVHSGRIKGIEGTVNRKGAKCAICDSPVGFPHIRSEGQEGRMNQRLMAIVAEGSRGRVYLSPMEEHVAVATSAKPNWKPEAVLPSNPRDFKTPNYGMTTFADLFTPRQLVALTTFSDLVEKAREQALADAIKSGMRDDGKGIEGGGTGATAYADAVATYLGFGVSRMSNTLCTIARWTPARDQTVTAFARQALPMTWDYPEVNPFAEAAGDLRVSLQSISDAIDWLPTLESGRVAQLDARASLKQLSNLAVATDPPYYDNIGYADLSDFFYIWLRRSLSQVYPVACSTLLTPKTEELIASPYRHNGSRQKAESFFESGLKEVFKEICRASTEAAPMTLFYAYKQSETEDGGRTASTGWETMLKGLLDSGFEVTGTWPMRSELSNRPIASGTNALASSVVLACRPRPADASLGTRRELLRQLQSELPATLKPLQKANIAPVDLPQAAVGPGMAVFSRYSKVVESDGTEMTVRDALALINQELDRVLAEQDSEYDPYTR